MRLINSDALKETLDYYIRMAGWSKEINMALGWVKDDFIDAEPTVIEIESVKHGKWIKADSQQYFRKHYPCFTCSECGYRKDSQKEWNYCSHCGARMDEE